MPDHVPRLCPTCGSPLTARLRCAPCGVVLERRRHDAADAAPPGRARQRMADPLQHAIESLTPWIRGERGIWAPR